MSNVGETQILVALLKMLFVITFKFYKNAGWLIKKKQVIIILAGCFKLDYFYEVGWFTFKLLERVNNSDWKQKIETEKQQDHNPTYFFTSFHKSFSYLFASSLILSAKFLYQTLDPRKQSFFPIAIFLVN